MEYVIGLFADRHQADKSVEALKAAAVSEDEYAVKDHETTVKGWLERLFDMEEPQSTMEAHGLRRETSAWLDTQIESGRVMVAVRTSASRGHQSSPIGCRSERYSADKVGPWGRPECRVVCASDSSTSP